MARINLKQKRACIEAVGYTICGPRVASNLDGWYALLPGESAFIDTTCAHAADPAVPLQKNYLGFFISEDDLLNEVFDRLPSSRWVVPRTLGGEYQRLPDRYAGSRKYDIDLACNGCKHAHYTAPGGQLWSNDPRMHMPHILCSYFAAHIPMVVEKKRGCDGRLSPEIVRIEIPARCPTVAENIKRNTV